MEWKDHDDDDGVMAKLLKVVFCVMHALCKVFKGKILISEIRGRYREMHV